VTITMNGILQLENIWTRTTNQLGSENDDPMIAWVWFRSYIRSRDWQVVRELNCLTVSAHSFRELVAIAGIPWTPLSDDWIAHCCHCLTKNEESLRSLCGKESAITAMSSLVLRLEIYLGDDGETHFRWTKESNTPTVVATALDADRRSLRKSVSSRSRLQALTPGFHSKELLEKLLLGKVVSSKIGYTYTCSAQLSSAPIPAPKSQNSETGNSLSLWRTPPHALTFEQMTRDIISILQYPRNTHASRVILF
jgi:hypothetical protein